MSETRKPLSPTAISALREHGTPKIITIGAGGIEPADPHTEEALHDSQAVEVLTKRFAEDGMNFSKLMASGGITSVVFNPEKGGQGTSENGQYVVWIDLDQAQGLTGDEKRALIQHGKPQVVSIGTTGTEPSAHDHDKLLEDATARRVLTKRFKDAGIKFEDIVASGGISNVTFTPETGGQGHSDNGLYEVTIDINEARPRILTTTQQPLSFTARVGTSGLAASEFLDRSTPIGSYAEKFDPNEQDPDRDWHPYGGLG